MIIKIKCPNCDKQLEIIIKKGKVVSIQKDTTFINSDKEIKKILKENGVEFG
jgi:ssDNA-binding Zn-finger/Zn-ribbon topoisomerase 1